MTVTYQVGGGGHLDIDFWVSCLALVAGIRIFIHPTAVRPRRENTRKADQTVHREHLNNC